MSDTPERPAADRPTTVTSGDGTGHAAVDAVLESLDRLDERPVSEHAAVFEEAHTRLRAALQGEPAADA